MQKTTKEKRYTIPQAAKITKFTLRSLYKIIAENRIPSEKNDHGQIVISETWVNALKPPAGNWITVKEYRKITGYARASIYWRIQNGDLEHKDTGFNKTWVPAPSKAELEQIKKRRENKKSCRK